MIRHHPDLATLARFASGTLDKGRSFVVGAHACGCRKCLSLLRGFEDIGGALLEDSAPAVLSSGAGDDMLAAVLRDQQHPFSQDRVQSPGVNLDLSTVLTTFREGPWRWLGPGIHIRPLSPAGKGEARVFLLKAAPGARLPEHTYSGSECTLVLTGAYSHTNGRYTAGDFEEGDEAVAYEALAEGEVCICLVAVEGKLRSQGLLGRLIRPFVRV